MGEFDSCGTNKLTNFQLAIKRLRDSGFSESYVSNFKIVLWDIPNSYYRRTSEYTLKTSLMRLTSSIWQVMIQVSLPSYWEMVR